MPLSYYVNINQENILKTLFSACIFLLWSQFSFIKPFFSPFSFFFDIYPKCSQDNIYYKDYIDFTEATTSILVNQSNFNFNLQSMQLHVDHSDLMHSMCKKYVDFNFLWILNISKIFGLQISDLEQSWGSMWWGIKRHKSKASDKLWQYYSLLFTFCCRSRKHFCSVLILSSLSILSPNLCSLWFWCCISLCTGGFTHFFNIHCWGLGLVAGGVFNCSLRLPQDAPF